MIYYLKHRKFKWHNKQINKMKKSILLITFFITSFFGYSQTTIIMEKENGVYKVPCKVNGLPLKFIFDTGASDVSISLTEAMFMLKNGYLKKEDLGESVYFSIANGDVEKGTKLNLKEIEFGGLKLYNISASIAHQTSAPLLLGQSVIEKLGKIQLDGNRLTIMNGSAKSYNYNDKNISNSGSSTSKSSGEFDFSSLPTYAGYIDTSDTIPIYNIPDMVNGNSLDNIVGYKILIIKKVNDKYYQVKSGNITGYVFVSFIMRSGTIKYLKKEPVNKKKSNVLKDD